MVRQQKRIWLRGLLVVMLVSVMLGGTGWKIDCGRDDDKKDDGASTPQPQPTINAPSGLVSNATSSSEISIAWADNSDNEDGFKIERKTSASGTYAQIATVTANTAAYSDTGLTASTAYYYRVKAYNSAGNSNYSNETSATTQAVITAPNAPSSLLAATVASSYITLTWSDNSVNEDGFKLERKTGSGGTYTQITTVNANITTYSDTGLSASTTYYYRVRAYNASENSTYSNEAYATTQSVAPPSSTAKIAYAYSGDIWVMNHDGSNQINLTNTSGYTETSPFWSPDGTRILYDSNEAGNFDIYIMNADGSSKNRLTNDSRDERGPAFSFSGTKIAWSLNDAYYSDDIWVMDWNGVTVSNKTQLTNTSYLQSGPRWSPDGTKIAYWCYNPLGNGGTIEIVAVPTGTITTLVTDGTYDNKKPTWSLDGTQIYYSRSIRYGGTNSIRRVNADGTNDVLIVDLAPSAVEDNSLIMCPDGTTLLFIKGAGGAGSGDIWRIEVDGTGAAQIITGSAQSPVMQPDVKKIAYVDNGDIWVMNKDGANPVNLTNTSGISERQPVWTPDGKKILYASNAAGNYDIYVMDAAGSNAIRLTSDSRDEWEPSFSFNGSKIAWSLNDGYYSDDIWIMDWNGVTVSNKTQLTNTSYRQSQPRWSPDGAKIAYWCYNPLGSGGTIEVVTVPAGIITALVTDGTYDNKSPVWSIDGTKVYYSRSVRYGGTNSIRRVNSDGTNDVLIVDLAPSTMESNALAPCPDGVTMLFIKNTSGGGGGDIWQINTDGSNPVQLTTGKLLYEPAMQP